MLGGSSALNFLVWDRASEAEYNAWETLGNPGWVSTVMNRSISKYLIFILQNWDSLFSYMKKAETYTAPTKAIATALDTTSSSADFGTSGPIHVSFVKYAAVISINCDSYLRYFSITDTPLRSLNCGSPHCSRSVSQRTTTRWLARISVFLMNPPTSTPQTRPAPTPRQVTCSRTKHGRTWPCSPVLLFRRSTGQLRKPVATLRPPG